MIELVKYQCEYCGEIYDSRIECEDCERHCHGQKYVNKVIWYDEDMNQLPMLLHKYDEVFYIAWKDKKAMRELLCELYQDCYDMNGLDEKHIIENEGVLVYQAGTWENLQNLKNYIQQIENKIGGLNNEKSIK